MASGSESLEISKANHENGLPELDEQQQQSLEEHSTPFLGKWEKLISTTNWEKGAIIVEWRTEMEKVAKQSGLPKSCCSDEQWSQLCGGATPQHVGRLRRTHDRFGHVFTEYEGLYWIHFYAALDWDDAEMWLEGAIQNSWSVSKMRNARWETMGKRPEDQPRVEQIVVSEPDVEDKSADSSARLSDRDSDYAQGPIPEGPDFGDEDVGGGKSRGDASEEQLEAGESLAAPKGPKIRPFESFTELPDDISKAANAFKIAIIKHKAGEWDEFAMEDLFELLDALKALATAESG